MSRIYLRVRNYDNAQLFSLRLRTYFFFWKKKKSGKWFYAGDDRTGIVAWNRARRESRRRETMSSPDIGGILEKSKELDQLRKEQEEVLVEINKMHKKLQTSESLSLTHCLK